MKGASPLLRISVGVVVERRVATSPWVDYLWMPVTVLAGEPVTAPWTPLSSDGDRTMFYAGTAEIQFFRSETANYRDNLASATPSLWVALRSTVGEPPFSILAVTADPAEGEALTEAGNDLVEPVPMPRYVQEAAAEFVAAHHVDRGFLKRQRDPPDPEALARRTHGPGDEK